ncbi:hypothetical protein QQP08_023147 [Theobroma cacao]|nr:hypothetical protein QQP08_023147 [Theobroma cacao]
MWTGGFRFRAKVLSPSRDYGRCIFLISYISLCNKNEKENARQSLSGDKGFDSFESLFRAFNL